MQDEPRKHQSGRGEVRWGWKGSHCRYIKEQVTTVGNWDSVPLVFSGGLLGTGLSVVPPEG